MQKSDIDGVYVANGSNTELGIKPGDKITVKLQHPWVRLYRTDGSLIGYLFPMAFKKEVDNGYLTKVSS